MNVRQEDARDIGEVLGVGEAPRQRKFFRYGAFAIVILCLIAVGAWYFARRERSTIQYRTAEVTRGDLTVTVTATGTVQPVNQVDVGTEISGTIKASWSPSTWLRTNCDDVKSLVIFRSAEPAEA